jgi:2-oxoisovalerate dehydrogenase E2 component (dihydrolipoyl transacylase)
MSTYGVKLPDVGEGVAEAELIEWRVQVGDTVTTDSVLAEVMTDKATVEVASPVAGVVVALHGEPGDVLAVGSELVGVELSGDAPAPRPSPAHAPSAAPTPLATTVRPEPVAPAEPRPSKDGRSTAAPAVRARARALGIDLSTIAGTGPDGRVVHTDLDRHLTGGGRSTAGSPAADEPHLEPVRGMRRRIADRLTSSWTEIPHITYVDAVDLTDLETLRAELNRRGAHRDVRLTILPFLVRAIVLACADQPRLNATYDAGAETLSVFDAVHVGIARRAGGAGAAPRRGAWRVGHRRRDQPSGGRRS